MPTRVHTRRRSAANVAISFVVGAIVLIAASSVAAQTYTWTFVTNTTSEFTFARTGSGSQGSWSVVKASGAPRGDYALAQVDRDRTDYHFPLAIAKRPILRDVSLSV